MSKKEPPSTDLPKKVERTDFNDKKKLYLSQRSNNPIVAREVPKPEDLERRQNLLRWTRWGLPATALVLLVSIAAWPEIDRAINSNKEILKQLSKIKVESGTMHGASFHGLDSHNRPYTITSKQVHQNADGLIRLTYPKADILFQNNSWMMVTSDQGNFLQHSQNLSLSKNVVLYRDDGLFMYSPIADISMKSSVITANDWVHAEGTFGVLDAQAYFLDMHAGIAQFKGPGRLILNDDKKSSASSTTRNDSIQGQNKQPSFVNPSTSSESSP